MREGSKRKRGRTITSYQVLRRDKLFRCHEKETKQEREREKTKNTVRIRGIGKKNKNNMQCMIMHEHVIC